MLTRRGTTDAQLHAVFGRIVADGLRPVSAGLAIVYTALGLVRLRMPYHPGHHVHLPMAWTTAALLLVVSLVLRRRPLPPRLGHRAAAALAAVVLANSVVDLAVEKPDETVLFMFLAIGAGALLLSWRWLGLVLAATATGWLAVATTRWASAPGDWLEFGAFLVIAMVLAVMIHALRVRSIADIERTRRYYTGLIENTLDVTIVVDQEATNRYLSPSVERVLGWKPEELIGKSGFDLVHPDDLEEVALFLAQRSDVPGSTAPIEVRCRHKDGSWRVIEAVTNNLLENPSIGGIVVNARDVTERKRADELVRKSRTQLAEAQRIARIGSFSLDLASGAVSWSDELFRICGLEPGECEPAFERYLELTPPEDRPLVRRLTEEVIAGRGSFSVEHRLVHRDGTERVVHREGSVIADENGRPVRVVGTVQDITERRRAEQVAREAEAKYRTLVETVPAVVYLEPAGGDRADYISPQVEALTGFSPDEWKREGFWSERIHVEDRERVRSEDRRTNETGEPYRAEYRFVASDGRVLWIQDEAVLVRDEEGKPLFWQGVMLDVTERKRAEEAAEVARERLERVVAASLDAIVEMDGGGRVTLWNEGAERVFGYAADEVLGQKLHDLCASPEDRAAFERGFEAFRRTGEGHVVGRVVEVEGVRRDGTRIPVELSVAPVTLDGVRGAVGIVRDVTDRKWAERRVRLLATVALAIAEAPTLDEVLEVALRMVCEATGWILGEAWISRPDGSALEPGPSWCAAEAGLEGFRTESGRTVFAPGVGLPGRVWASGRSAWIPDVTEDPNFPRAPAAREAGLRAAVAVPVLVGDEVVAVMGFFLREPRAEDTAFVDLISGIAAQLGSAVRRRQAEERLRGAEEKYRTLVERVPATIYVWEIDEEGNHRYENSPQFARMLGHTHEEIADMQDFWIERLHPDDRDWVQAVSDGVGETGETMAIEYRYLHRDGHVVWVRDEATLIERHPDGKPRLFHGVMVDITDRREAEQHLREAEARYRALVEQMPAIVYMDLPTEEMITTYVSPQIEEVLGVSQEQFVEDPLLWERHIHPDDLAPTLAGYREFIETDADDDYLEYRWVRPDGEIVWINDRATKVRGEDGRVLMIQGVMFDVTERKRTEEVLRESEAELRRSMEVLRRTDEERRKLLVYLVTAEEEAREHMAEAVRDDSIQQMAAVGMRLETLKRRLTDPGELGAVDQLGKSVDHAVHRLRHLLVELRPRTLDLDGLAAALRQYLQEVRTEAGFEFSVEDRLSVEPQEEMRATAYRIVQDAIANVHRHAHAKRVEVVLEDRETGFLVRVSDDGVGFRLEEDAGIEAAHMGLAAMRERAELAGGWLRVKSAPGAGTTVESWLPGGGAAVRS